MDLLFSKTANLFDRPADTLLGEDLDSDGTVDCSHPNDLGMYRMTDALEAVLRPIHEKAIQK